RVEVSGPGRPGLDLVRRHGREGVLEQIAATGRWGWYFRAQNEAWLEPGLAITLLDRPYPQWPVIRVADTIRTDRGAAAELAGCPALAERWRGAVTSA
ncbi:MAG: MOSC domain-containing protein, partial [Gemmatimonadales bacterium]